jgi:ubiquinone/menaquinone biosynthesis C-methylase UbiE
VAFARSEEYRIGDDVFVKEFLQNGHVRFSKNSTELSLSDWNREINALQPMALLANHPNPFIRYKESQRRRSFLKLIECTAESIVADVGCESGYFAEQLSRKCMKVYCVDIDSRFLKMARKRVGEQRGAFVESDSQQLALRDNCVDAAVAGEILEHLPDPSLGLRELVRITRPSGKIYISVPNEPLLLFSKRIVRFLHLTPSLGRLNPGIAIGHLRVMNKKTLKLICRDWVEIERMFYTKPFLLNVFAVLKPRK